LSGFNLKTAFIFNQIHGRKQLQDEETECRINFLVGIVREERKDFKRQKREFQLGKYQQTHMKNVEK